MNILNRNEKNGITIGDLHINFQRTCRVPEEQLNDLPAGLGNFPIFKVSDFSSGTPNTWREDGFFMPMYEQEAMWISFNNYVRPKALIVGAGNINAISGKPFDASKIDHTKPSTIDVKLEEEQNYLVVPPQPWLDGWKAEDGKVYQFVAAKIGSGQTVEGQITGEEKASGIQFIVYDAKDGVKLMPAYKPHLNSSLTEECCLESFGALRGIENIVEEMGLGRGGEINQKIYPDPHSINVWKPTPTAVEIVYLVSIKDFKQVTGHDAPPTPITQETYQNLGLPWFKLQDKHYADTKGSDTFGKLKPVGYNPLEKLQPKKQD